VCYTIFMLSAFPQLFNYSIFAIAGLRIFFGMWFLSYAYTTLFHKRTQESPNLSWLKKANSGIAFLVGVFTFIGLFTQVAILLGLFVLLIQYYFSVRSNKVTRETFMLGFYIAVIGLTLLFLGPGVPAIDLPL